MKFLSSYNHTSLPLRKFSDMFERTEAHKGFFPYLLHTWTNQNYVGDIPKVSCFYEIIHSKVVQDNGIVSLILCLKVYAMIFWNGMKNKTYRM